MNKNAEPEEQASREATAREGKNNDPRTASDRVKVVGIAIDNLSENFIRGKIL